jgi:hypothetical protein
MSNVMMMKHVSRRKLRRLLELLLRPQTSVRHYGWEPEMSL